MAKIGAITNTLSMGRTSATKPAAALVRTRRHHAGSWTARTNRPVTATAPSSTYRLGMTSEPKAAVNQMVEKKRAGAVATAGRSTRSQGQKAVERGAEFGSVVCLHALDSERQFRQNVVDKLDGGFLVAARGRRHLRSELMAGAVS
jgi:hypothetical protein